MHVHLSLLFYTLIGSLPHDPEFAHSDWMFDFIDQVLMSSYASWGPGVSFYSVLVFLLLFYLCYFLIQYVVIIVSWYAHTLYARIPSLLFYTLIGSLSDNLGFVHPDWILPSIDQVFVEIVRFARTLSFFYSILIFLLLFYLNYFLILSISHPVAISFLFHMISCVDIYM